MRECLYEMPRIPLMTNGNDDGKTVYALEGLNGVGKSTVINSITSDYDDIRTIYSVPDVMLSSSEIKHFVLENEEPLLGAFFYLSGIMAAAGQIKDMDEKTVVMDRSLWSTLAAAYSKDETTLPVLAGTLELVKDKVRFPDKIIVLRASFESCLERIGKKLSGQEFDKDTEEIFYKKYRFYDILKESGYPVVFVDTDGKSAGEVCGMVKDIIGIDEPPALPNPLATMEMGKRGEV